MNLGRRRVPRSEILNPINRVESPSSSCLVKCMSSIRTEFLLWRNGHIKNVVLVEVSSILLL